MSSRGGGGNGPLEGKAEGKVEGWSRVRGDESTGRVVTETHAMPNASTMAIDREKESAPIE